MKKVILLAAFGVTSILSATEVNSKSDTKSKYYPVTITSSCGYTQTFEVGPTDSIDCVVVESNQMEEECAAPFTNPILAGMP
ncbi:hypothetical protein [Chryseobacterium sp. PMSZPI]|uniref:hypothetical protein n=1 Tax=Chryseobacterium sp. PMSZPI TaxID=1033900 RepID=UPI000C320EA2|nr:hypothetical protein [Chryseobacterium sp. PMSZPI]PKF74139.1 hypothetical protein CW752_11260 [Chryseobacterium sp. PMSZPI]